jgi:phenylacetate-CoA ligase
MAADLESSFVRHVIHPLWAWRDHPAYKRHLANFRRSQYFNQEQLAELQRTQVRDLLQHAYAHCAFYRDRMQAAGLSPNDFNDIACLRALPTLTKTDIQRNMAGLQADNVPESARQRNQTGGSTGAPLQFYVDKERLDSRMASTVRHDAWANYGPGDWLATLWGARLDLAEDDTFVNRMRNRLLYRSISLNTSAVSEKDWQVFLADVRRFKPRAMLAYAQSAVMFADYVRENKIQDITFDSIITSAEVLLPGQREYLQETFHGTVFNRYGCREVSVIASECEQHRGMHVNADALYVEIEPDPTLPAGCGKVIITDMFNRSMPLIRYEIEDIASWSASQQCPCGRKLPLLNDLQGRSTDFLIMPSGRKVSGPSLTLVIADVAELQHMQIVQDAADHIILRCVPGKGWSTSVEDTLRRRLGLYVDPGVQTDIEICTELEISASGKHRFVINRLKPQVAGTVR